MSIEKAAFRERLLQSEDVNPKHRGKYEREVKAMIERQVTGIEKLMYFCFLGLGLFFLIVFGGVAIFAPSDLPLGARLVFGLGSLFGLTFAGLVGWIIVKGRTNLKTHPSAMVGISWAFVIIVVTYLLVNADRFSTPIEGVKALVSGLVFLVMAATFMIKNWVDQSELKTREKLLEIEYKVAELSEKLGREQ